MDVNSLADGSIAGGCSAASEVRAPGTASMIVMMELVYPPLIALGMFATDIAFAPIQHQKAVWPGGLQSSPLLGKLLVSH